MGIEVLKFAGNKRGHCSIGHGVTIFCYCDQTKVQHFPSAERQFTQQIVVGTVEFTQDYIASADS